jgi:signal transduction histidine kinase
MPTQASSQRADARTSSDDAAAQAATTLKRLEALFEKWPWRDAGEFKNARQRAGEHARQLLAGGCSEEHVHAALLVAAVDLIGALRTQLAGLPEQASELVIALEQLTGITRIELARETLRAPELLAMAPGEGVRAQLAMLMALAPLRSLSLWRRDADGVISCMCHLGDVGPSRGEQHLAKQRLSGATVEPNPRGWLLGVPVGAAEKPIAALVGSGSPGDRELSHALLGESVPMLAAMLEREALMAQNAAVENALIEASERKLVRLGFDLHDGPIQDVAVLADDLRLFRDQLELMLGSSHDRDLVRGRIEDLDAQITSVDAELRRLSGEVQAASILLNQPVRDALRQRVRAFAMRTGIKPRLSLSGNLNELSTSQQIALLNIVQEALSNIREHARASKVTISVSTGRDGVHAKIVDDGRGFEIEPTLMRAAREGRIGLLAMNERVRLLGGECRIESRPGGGTSVSVALKPWPPSLGTEAAAARSRKAQAPASRRRSRTAA